MFGHILRLIILFALIFGLVYLLYENGFGTFTSKRAAMFWGKNNFKNKKHSATFSSCTGFLKRVIKLKEARKYTIILDANISKGDLKVIIQDSKKCDVLVLTPENPVGYIDAQANSKYYFAFHMHKATGNYELTWK